MLVQSLLVHAEYELDVGQLADAGFELFVGTVLLAVVLQDHVPVLWKVLFDQLYGV